MAAHAEMLHDVALFSLLDDRERESLAEMIDVAKFDKGDIVFKFGDAGDAMYIVVRGTVQVFVEDYSGEKISLAENNAGDIFGEISLLDGGSRTATAIAIDESELLVFQRQDLLELITKHPHAAMDLLTMVGR